MGKLVLGSGSKVRAELLRKAGFEFEVALADCDEDAVRAAHLSAAPAELSLILARAKGKALAPHFPDALVITADQICALGERIFNKPGTEESARAQLKALCGQRHAQHSGVCVMQGGEVLWETVESAWLTMRDLSDAQIREYVAEDMPLAACGAYRLESNGADLFTAIDGVPEVIMGLPVVPLVQALRKLGVDESLSR